MNDINTSLATFQEDASYVSLSFLIFQSVYYAVFGLVGAFGNILTLLALLTSDRLKSTCNMFIGNLSICDLITNTFSAAIAIVRSISGDSWQRDSFICRFQYCVSAIVSGVALMTLLCIAINRYLALARPFSTYHLCCHTKGAMLGIAVCWISAVLLIVLPIIRGTRRPVYDPYINACVQDHEIGTNWFRTTVILFFYVVLPSAIIAPCLYRMMFIVVRSSKNRVFPANPHDRENDDQLVATNTIPTSLTIRSVSAVIQESTSFPRQNKRERSKEEARLTKMPLLVFLVFAICWLPYCIVHILSKYVEVSAAARKIAFMCIWTNSSINPYLYAFTSQNFRLAYKRILKCRKGDASSSSSLQ